MKKQTLIILILLAPFTGQLFAQQKVDRFCIVEIYFQPFKKNKNVDIDYGQKNNFNHLKDSVTIAKLEAIKERCSSNVDVVNYMSDLGWALVQTITKGGGYSFVFKKEFGRDEIVWEK